MIPLKAHFNRRKKYTDKVTDPLIMRSCPQAKIARKTERIAKCNAAKAFKADGILLYAYRCPHCRLWHLTKSPQRRAK